MDIITNFSESYEQIIDRITKFSIQQARDAIVEEFEKIDRELYFRSKGTYTLLRKQVRTLITRVGEIRFKRRYYKENETGKNVYLLDSYLKIPKYSRISDQIKIDIMIAATEASYSKISSIVFLEDYSIAKSTICNIVKKSDIAIIENCDNMINNNDKIHLQIDEKYVNVTTSRNKIRHYTASIFKGVINKKRRRKLLNKCIITANNLAMLFKKINYYLIKKYKVSVDDEIYLSGDLATYIQNAPNKINCCKAIYVPDFWHVKKALKDELGILVNKSTLNDDSFWKTLNENSSLYTEPIKRIIKLKATQKHVFESYLNKDYEGCSQECMNSHYVAPRIGKLPYRFLPSTISKLMEIRCAIINNDKISIGFHCKYYDEPNFDLGTLALLYPERNSISYNNFRKQTASLLKRIVYSF